MEETLFKLARAITDTGTDTVSSKGGTITYRITSLKRKLVNGKVVSTSTPSCTLGSASVSWAIWGGVTVGDGYLDVKINYSENTGSSRSTTLIFDQNGSNNKINLTVTQESGVTYTYYLKISNVNSTIGANIGATTTIMVYSYMIRNDGEKMAKPPSVGATPSFANKVIVKDGSVIAGAPDWYQIVVEATAANIGSSERSEILLVTCGDQREAVTIRQKAAEQYITLTIHWPLNTNSAAFFKKGQKPQSNSSTSTAYFTFSILDDTSVHKYKKSEGIRVNLRDGNSEMAYPGDSISAYRFINQAWQLISTFILPSSDQSITL